MSAETDSLSGPTLSPRDCVLAFGVPTDQDDFAASLLDNHRDYAKGYLGGWAQYERNFLSRVNKHTKIFAQLGVTVLFDLKSIGLHDLFGRGSVITLFTHWTYYGIELCDGILSIPLTVQSIPVEFSGVLDLCVCHPDELAKLILRERPKCSVRYLGYTQVNPLFWLEFYSGLYKLLSLGTFHTYSDALTEFTLSLRKQVRGENGRL